MLLLYVRVTRTSEVIEFRPENGRLAGDATRRASREPGNARGCREIDLGTIPWLLVSGICKGALGALMIGVVASGSSGK